MKQRAGTGQGDLNGFLDAGSHMQGELHFDDTFRIEGRFTGKIHSAGELVVGEKGEVDGEVVVGTVYVSGTLRGTVRAGRIEIAPPGKVHAELETPSLVIADGAFFEGQCAMVTTAPPATAPRPQPVLRPEARGSSVAG